MFVTRFIMTVVCLQYASESYAYKNIVVRNTRPRSVNKRPVNVEQYIVKQRPSPGYSVESGSGDNQWKPILDAHSTIPASLHKRRKPIRPAQKYTPNIIFTTEYYPKQNLQSASANYIANQSLLVADYTPQLKPHSKTKTVKHQQYIPKKSGSHYEVHEQVNEDINNYDASQNRFRYQQIAAGKPVGKPLGNPVKFAEPVTEKHIHHVHYHKPSSNDGRHAVRPHLRKVRLTSTSIRPY